MTLELSDSHRCTHDCTFRHPTARNLVWGDARSMYGLSAQFARNANEKPKVTRNGPASARNPSPEENLY